MRRISGLMAVIHDPTDTVIGFGISARESAKTRTRKRSYDRIKASAFPSTASKLVIVDPKIDTTPIEQYRESPLEFSFLIGDENTEGIITTHLSIKAQVECRKLPDRERFEKLATLIRNNTTRERCPDGPWCVIYEARGELFLGCEKLLRKTTVGFNPKRSAFLAPGFDTVLTFL